MKENQTLLADNISAARRSICQVVEALEQAHNLQTPKGETGAEFVNIRYRLKDSADIFRAKVLPLTNDFVRNIKDFLNEFYGPCVEFEDWKDDFGDCLEAVKTRRCISVSLGQMYMRLAREFAKENPPLTTLAGALEGEVELLKRELERLDVSIAEKTRQSATWRGWFLMLLGRILSIFRWEQTSKGGVEVQREQRRKKQENIQQLDDLSRGVKSVRLHLVPALENFVNSMQFIAGFFDVMRRDLIAISKTSDAAKKRHFIRYQQTAVAISGRVDAFNMVESAVSLKMSSLPEPETVKATKGAMDRKAEAWLQSIIDEQETEEARQLLRAVKETF